MTSLQVIVPAAEIEDSRTATISATATTSRSDSSVASSESSTGGLGYKRPSRRKKPAFVSGSNDVLSPKIARIVSSESGLSGKPVEGPSLLDSILNQMTKTETVRSANAKFLEQCAVQEEHEMNRRRALNMLQSPERSTEEQTSGVKCLCPSGEITERNIMEADDKSGMVCIKCGVMVGLSLTHCLYERVQRFDIPPAGSGNESKDRKSFGVESSKERAKIKLANVQSTKVGRALQNPQLKIQRQASRAEHTERVGLTRAQSQLMDRAMVEVNKMIQGIGRDPDQCPVFDWATRAIEKAFKTAGAHSVLCGDSNRRWACEERRYECPALILSASALSIASEAVRSAIEAIVANESDEDGTAKTDLAVSVRQTKSLLSPVLSTYASAVHVSEPLHRRFHALLYGNMKSACKLAPLHSAENSASTSSFAGNDSPLIDISTKVKIGIESLLKLGWIDFAVAREANGFCASAEFVQWSLPLSEWSSDVLALMVAMSATSGDKSRLQTHLEKLARTERLSLKTIEENMIGSLVKDETFTDNPWN